MSTTAKQDGTVKRSPDHGSHLPLPSFAPLRPSSDDHSVNVQSSASGSQRSRSNASSHDGKEPARDSNSLGSSLGNSVHNGNVEEPKPHRSRGSGGFLVDPLSHSSKLSRNFHLGSQKRSKGKRNADDAQLSIPKTRSKAMQAEQKMTIIGGSPLATELVREDDEDEVAQHDSFDGHDAEQRVRFSGSLNGHSGHGTNDHQISSTARPETRNIGFDSDSAQIVRMALTLSEGRRRQASDRRIPSGAIQRSASGRSQNQARTSLRPVSVGQYLGTVRDASRKDPPVLESTSPPSSRHTVSMSDPFLDTQGAPNGIMDDEGSLELSRATVMRVQKAKTYFELAYENRRLLSHLPPIRRPGTLAKHRSHEAHSRTYNPLQYVRNRKLRVWEKSSINGEAEGWHDIEKVRAWVDAVVNGHTETQHDPNEIVRLPDLDQASASYDEEMVDPAQKRIPKSTHDKQHSRSTRPRSDWVTHPGDLIADAFWLEQGLNKTKIQDKDGNHIYYSDTKFNFLGWRNRPPTAVPLNLQQQTPPPDVQSQQRIDSPPPSALPELPTFASADDREKRYSRLHKQPANRALGRTKRRHFEEFGFSSDSENSQTDISSHRGNSRGRKRFSRRRELFDLSNGKPAKLVESGSDRSRDSRSQSHALRNGSSPPSGPGSKRTSMDLARFTRFRKREKDRGNSVSGRSRSRPHSHKPLGRQQTASTYAGEGVFRRSAEYDTTAPNSPSVPGFPSIAVNLSPPLSRSPSPTKKSLVKKFNPFRDRSNRRHDQDDDYADPDTEPDVDGIEPTSTIGLRGQSSRIENNLNGYQHDSQGTSPMNRGIDPFSKERRRSSAGEEDLPLPTIGHEHRDSVSRVSTRSAAPSHKDEHSHRIRGLFKGGRIAEIVGHEVHRVGDFIWKRDPPYEGRHRHSASTSSLKSVQTEDELDHPNGNVPYKTPQRKAQGVESTPITTASDDPTSSSSPRSGPGSDERAQYNNPNLPNFSSPFQRDRDKQDERKALEVPNEAALSLSQVSSHPRTSKSPRLGELPRLVMPDASPEASRQDSYFGQGLERSRSASNLFNSAIRDTSASGLGSELRPTRSHLDLVRTLSPSRSEHSEAPLDAAAALKKDTSRVEVLLLSSAVKARDIVFRADTIRQPDAMPPVILETLASGQSSSASSGGRNSNSIRRREEHVLAARNMIATLTSQSAEFNNKLTSFSDTLAPSLHRELQILEDMVDNTLTPRVRKAADEAGELSMKLTTTSTLAVKSINDSIDVALRRRRHGPIRWVRRAGYQVIEWLVVGVLWWIWLIVTVVRGAGGVLRRVGRVGRWVLWLD